jgi:hypothetical protein
VTVVRCKGETLKGDRCRREAGPGSDYCSIHADQAPAGGTGRGRRSGWDPETVAKTALGFALVGVIVLFRLRR